MAFQHGTQPDQRRDISPLNQTPTWDLLITGHPRTVPAEPPSPGQTRGRVCWDPATRADVAADTGRRVSRQGFGL